MTKKKHVCFTRNLFIVHSSLSLEIVLILSSKIKIKSLRREKIQNIMKELHKPEEKKKMEY